MNHGKQIRLFLTDGSASGIRYAELMNWTGQAFALPKSLFNKLQEWPETQRAGVYVLIGLNEAGDDAVYIGESENVAKRLLNHLSNPNPKLDDIVQGFFFTSKDDNLTKGHITFLEERLVKRAESAKRFEVEYGREPSEKLLSKPEIATMEEFLENLYLVSAALGFNVFEMPQSETVVTYGQTVFSFALEDNVTATGYLTEDGFIVKAGSLAKASDATTLQGGYKAKREELRKKGVLTEEGNHLKFVQDYTFTSSSAAAAVVAGSQRSGPKSWKNPNGKTLGEIEAAEAATNEAALEEPTVAVTQS